MRHVRWIWRFWRPHWQWLLLLATLTLLSSAVTIGYPLVFRYFIDGLKRALELHNPELASNTTWHWMWLIAVIGLARSMANIYPGVRAMINAKLEMDIRQFYFSEILSKPYRFFQRFRTGDLVTRLTDDIGGFPKIAWFCCSGIFRAVESSSKFIFCMAFMLTMNWHLALLSITPLPVMLYIFYRIRIALGQRAAERQRMISQTNDALEAAFSGVRIIKAFRGEANQTREFRRILNKRIGVELRVIRLWMGVTNVYWAIQFAGQIIVILAGGMMVIRGSLTMGEFYAFYVYLSLLLPPLMDIPNLFVTSRQAFACIDREIEIEQTDARAAALPSGLPAQPMPKVHALELRDVSFRYAPDLPLALDGVSLDLRAGERVAIVGTVGSGKSTLMKLAAGLLEPAGGEVRVNGQPLGEFSITLYREHVGYIPQEATLFSESVKDNVSFGRSFDERRIEDALAQAQVLREMQALPSGLDQVLGQRGLTISGGQKQRLAIARAVAGLPDLLLMDDCTSALDAENERAFWGSFRDLLPNTACLIVTHRLATARQADTICVLVSGRVVGQGSHSELAESCPEYRALLTREELEAALQTRAPAFAVSR